MPMNASQQQPTSAVIASPTIFDSIDLDFHGGAGNGVVFCIDTSGSMHAKLPAVRAELVELLTRWSSFRLPGRRFNLVRFGAGSVQRWSEGMVDCTPAAIIDADRWLSDGGSLGGCADIRAALMTTSIDAEKSGVASLCLVTDSLPAAVLSATELRSLTLPVHCVYPKESDRIPQPGLMAELQQLSGATGGTLTVANVGHRGCIERVAPVARTAPPASRWGRLGSQGAETAGFGNGKLCSVTTSLRCDPLLDAPALLFEGKDRDGWRFVYGTPGPPTNWGGSWSKFRANRPQIRALERVASLTSSPPPSIAGVSLLGRRVLARRRTDGRFYEGTVTAEATTPGHFNVELRTNSSKTDDGFTETEYQTTPVGELIALDDALRRHLLPGDCVLAPRGVGRPDYAPAIVLDGYERRKEQNEYDSLEDENDDQPSVRPLAVAFTDGASCVTEPGKAVRITHSLYHRLQLEAVMPRRERLALAEWTSDYPESTRPGYLATRPTREPDEYTAVRPVWPPGRMLPVPVPMVSHLSRRDEEDELYYDSDGENSRWPTSDTDRSIERRANQLIADFDSHGAGGVDVGVGSTLVKSNYGPKKSILKKPPPAPSRPSQYSAAVSSNWASENGWIGTGGYGVHQRSSMSRSTLRSSNLYNRRPLEIGACLGRSDLELESRRRRIDEHRRAASAERTDALQRSRAAAESVEAARLVRMARIRQDAAVSVGEPTESRVASRRHVTPPSEASQQRETRRRLVAPPTVSNEERPSRLRRVSPEASSGTLQRSVRFSGSEPTVAAWIRHQDHMTPAEARNSAQQLAARHKDCSTLLEQQRWSQSTAPQPEAARNKKPNSTKSKSTSTSKTTSSSSSSATAKLAA